MRKDILIIKLKKIFIFFLKFHINKIYLTKKYSIQLKFILTLTISSPDIIFLKRCTKNIIINNNPRMNIESLNSFTKYVEKIFSKSISSFNLKFLPFSKIIKIELS